MLAGEQAVLSNLKSKGLLKEEKPFVTTYSYAWSVYIKTPGYQTTVKLMKNKGFEQPYIDNILREAFDAGWNLKQ